MFDDRLDFFLYLIANGLHVFRVSLRLFYFSFVAGELSSCFLDRNLGSSIFNRPRERAQKTSSIHHRIGGTRSRHIFQQVFFRRLRRRATNDRIWRVIATHMRIKSFSREFIMWFLNVCFLFLQKNCFSKSIGATPSGFFGPLSELNSALRVEAVRETLHKFELHFFSPFSRSLASHLQKHSLTLFTCDWANKRTKRSSEYWTNRCARLEEEVAVVVNWAHQEKKKRSSEKKKRWRREEEVERKKSWKNMIKWKRARNGVNFVIKKNFQLLSKLRMKTARKM